MPDFQVKDSGERAEFDSGMVRDTDEGKARFDLLYPEGQPYEDQFLTRCAVHLAKGAKKYEERNWEKAEGPKELARFIASARRHLAQWAAGMDDEDHAAAVFFNLLGAEFVKWKMAQPKPVEPPPYWESIFVPNARIIWDDPTLPTAKSIMDEMKKMTLAFEVTKPGQADAFSLLFGSQPKSRSERFYFDRKAVPMRGCGDPECATCAEPEPEPKPSREDPRKPEQRDREEMAADLYAARVVGGDAESLDKVAAELVANGWHKGLPIDL